jgi:tRNA dimethylallyltransferase
MLAKVDPKTAADTPPNDVYRVIRSLEIYFQSGKRRSEIKSPPDRFLAHKFWLDLDRKVLENTIRYRTERMFEEGWIEEVACLVEKYPDFEGMPAAGALGYREILGYLKGDLGLEECKERIVRKNLQYAKRQRTWFRHQDGFSALTSVEELHKKLDFVLQ